MGTTLCWFASLYRERKWKDFPKNNLLNLFILKKSKNKGKKMENFPWFSRIDAFAYDFLCVLFHGKTLVQHCNLMNFHHSLFFRFSFHWCNGWSSQVLDPSDMHVKNRISQRKMILIIHSCFPVNFHDYHAFNPCSSIFISRILSITISA